MPALNEEEILELQSFSLRWWCGCTVKKNYCRECDEFFFYGHRAGCSVSHDPTNTVHAEHRTY